MMGNGDGQLRTLIVDDEDRAREMLRRDLAEIDGIEIVGEAENGAVAMERIAALQPDLVLLDIQMPVCDGFEVIRSIAGPLPAIVFVTAYSEHALKAFEVGAVDYLLKPFSVKRLRQAIARARMSWHSPRAHAESVGRAVNADAALRKRRLKIVASYGKDFLLLDADRVFAFQAKGEKVWIITKDRRYLATQTLGVITKRLAGSTFLRVHRSVLVNSDKIARISSLSSRRWLLTLTNSYQCIVSKRNTAMVRTLLQ